MLIVIITDSSRFFGEFWPSGFMVSWREEAVDPGVGMIMCSPSSPGCGVDENPPCGSVRDDGLSCCDFWMGDTPGVGPVIDVAEPGLTMEEFSICPGNGLSATRLLPFVLCHLMEKIKWKQSLLGIIRQQDLYQNHNQSLMCIYFVSFQIRGILVSSGCTY